MVFLIKTVLIITGMAVWAVILSIVCGVAGYYIRGWRGWKWMKKAWKESNNDWGIK